MDGMMEDGISRVTIATCGRYTVYKGRPHLLRDSVRMGPWGSGLVAFPGFSKEPKTKRCKKLCQKVAKTPFCQSPRLLLPTFGSRLFAYTPTTESHSHCDAAASSCSKQQQQQQLAPPPRRAHCPPHPASPPLCGKRRYSSIRLGIWPSHAALMYIARQMATIFSWWSLRSPPAAPKFARCMS